jgi:glycosyltransferase involved in cell wall biosynthesis
MRVAVFSHAHPTFSKGGGEFAAYYQYEGINAIAGNEAWFVAGAADKLLQFGTHISSLKDREYLIAVHADIPSLSTHLAVDDESDFAGMISTIQPDLIHFHHYVNLGLELIRAVKRLCPQAKIVVTLHEYIAICTNNGQMLKTNGNLCYQYSPRECSQCFPDKTPEFFFLRERYIKSFFNLVDAFVSPSYFLRDRYVAWGLPEEKISVIENGLPSGDKIPPRPLREGEIRGRFAYFGQFTPYKGVDIVMEAFARLPKQVKKQVSLDIFGSGLQWQTEEYKNQFQERLAANKDNIHYHGPYESHEMKRLMAGIDWVVMGSIWWENSPLVIQEAFKFGRPVICPDIGGMAEKVEHGIGGLNYRARDSMSLSALIESLVSDNQQYENLYAKLPKASTIENCVNAHLDLYAGL